MNPIKARLAGLRRRLLFANLWRGTCAVFALVAGVALVVGLADWWAQLPTLVRALLLAGLVTGAGFVALRYLIRPLRANNDDLSLALRIEDAYPELTDALASAVQFLDDGENSPLATPTLKQLAINQTLKKTERLDFNRIIDRRGLGLLTVAAIFVACGSFYWHSQYAGIADTALWRLFDPFGGHTWTRLAMEDAPSRVALAQPIVLKGDVGGVIPKQVRLQIDGAVVVDRTIPIKLEESRTEGTFIAPLDTTRIRTASKLRFRIEAGDATYPRNGGWHEIEISPPPSLIALDGLPSPQLELTFPEYTDLPSPVKLSPGQSQVDFVNGQPVVAGTHITLRARADRPLSKVYVEMQPEGTLIRTQAFATVMGHGTLGALASSFLAQSIAGRIPCVLEDDQQTFTSQFVAWIGGGYALHVEDADGLAKDYGAGLRILADPPPLVHLQSPGTSQSLLPDAQVQFKMLIEDEIFAIKSVYLEYRRKSVQGQNVQGQWADEAVRQVPISSHDFLGRQVPGILAQFANTPWAVPAWSQTSPRLRTKRLELAARWPLANRFQEGDIIVLQVIADDFNNLFSPSPRGRSHEVELRIVGKAELSKLLDEDFEKIQQAIVRLQIQQEKALKAVDDVLKNKKEPTSKDHDKLIEAAQLQRQIQERIGLREDEGLRNDLKQLEQKMRANQLPPSKLQDLAKTLGTELDRLAREDLPQIEAKISEARKELISGKPKEQSKEQSKENPGKESALGKTKELQKDAKQTLDELAKFLEPWANLQLVKGKVRELIAEQQELKKDTEALMPRKDEIPKDPGLQKELEKKAESHNSLAQKVQDTLDMMNRVAENNKDPDTARKVAAAERVGRMRQPQGKMREVAKMLKDTEQPKLSKANIEQKRTVEDLKKILDALEREDRDDDILKLRKKQKEARTELEDIANEMDVLRKKVQDAAAIQNPQERDARLKELAKEQKKLQQRAEDEARELARLQAHDASKALARAAQEMEKAAEKLAQGEVPEDFQEQANDDIDQAQMQLDQAQEELAREQLARIADQLKGLKKRQEAAVTETERIHTEVEKRGRWSFGLQQSMKSSGEVQKGLGDETDSLRDKIKQAIVFEHILERAAKSMTKAADSIKERLEEPNLAPLDEEELMLEKQAQAKTLRHQRAALRRLDTLLDALKDDPALAKKKDDEPKQEPAEKKEDGKKEEPKQQAGLNVRGGDGIPPLAQLKALRAEQVAIKLQTKEFTEQHPNLDNLTDDEQAELDAIRNEQGQLRDLFNQIVQSRKGEQP